MKAKKKKPAARKAPPVVVVKKQRRKPVTKREDDERENKERAKKDEESRARKAAEQKAAAKGEGAVTTQTIQDVPVEELMSTPEVSPAPNPPSPPGGEMIGEPTQLVPHTEEDDKALKEQRPTNPGPGERQRLTDEDRQR